MPWNAPFKIGDYLSDPLVRTDLRPPAERALYIVSRQPWRSKLPDQRDSVLYVGQSNDVRYRLGQLIGDALGFTGDSPGYSGSYYHSGGHRLWQYCLQEHVSVSTLFLAWYTSCVCLDCGEIALIGQLKPLLARGVPVQCAIHTPVLPLAQVCP